MTEEHIQKIIDEFNRVKGYSPQCKEKILKLLPQLHCNWELNVIYDNISILPYVDKLMEKYSRWNPIGCAWYNEGPAPFDSGFMALTLDDSEDMFTVIPHPSDPKQSIGIHVTEGIDGIVYELDMWNENHLTEDSLIQAIDSIIEKW